MSKPTGPTYCIRACRSLEDLSACLQLQRRIWGYPEGELYPLRLFVNLNHIGGHVIGAFARSAGGTHSARLSSSGALVGFVAGMPAWRSGKRYLHSLSLGVARGYQNCGLGRSLKLAQRKLALAAGVRWIEWTFDPLRAKNAFFNLVSLGAITRRYIPDYYGRVQSRLQQGLPSDRLVCEWWLGSARVRAAVAHKRVERRRTARKAGAEIVIPADFPALAERDQRAAVRLQRAVGKKFKECFRRGLVVTGFERDSTSGRYLLETPHEN
jgi:predicted GNAT superfamily acetyltransferase